MDNRPGSSLNGGTPVIKKYLPKSPLMATKYKVDRRQNSPIKKEKFKMQELTKKRSHLITTKYKLDRRQKMLPSTSATSSTSPKRSRFKRNSESAIANVTTRYKLDRRRKYSPTKRHLGLEGPVVVPENLNAGLGSKSKYRLDRREGSSNVTKKRHFQRKLTPTKYKVDRRPKLKSSPTSKDRTELQQVTKSASVSPQRTHQVGSGRMRLSSLSQRKTSLSQAPNSRHNSRFQYLRKLVSNAHKQLRKSNSEKPEKKRYFNESPDDQPIVAIIPRPRRRLQEAFSESEKSNKENLNGNLEVEVQVPSSSSAADPCSSSSSATDADSRRSRLMSRISRLRSKVVKKESVAPAFLSLKK